MTCAQVWYHGYSGRCYASLVAAMRAHVGKSGREGNGQEEVGRVGPERGKESGKRKGRLG